MKLKELLKKLQKLDPEMTVGFLTAPGQWGSVTGVHVDINSFTKKKVIIDCVESAKSWENQPI